MIIVVAVIVVFALIVALMLASGLRPQKSRRTWSRTEGGNKGGTGL